jgi:hypothetical protein
MLSFRVSQSEVGRKSGSGYPLREYREVEVYPVPIHHSQDLRILDSLLGR